MPLPQVRRLLAPLVRALCAGLGWGPASSAIGLWDDSTLRRFVRQSEFDRIQKGIDTRGDVRLGHFFTPDNISDRRVAASQLAIPGTGRKPTAGFLDVPRSVLPSQPLTFFGPRLTLSFTGRDLVRLPGTGLEVEFGIDPVVRGSALRLVPTP